VLSIFLQAEIFGVTRSLRNAFAFGYEDFLLKVSVEASWICSFLQPSEFQQRHLHVHRKCSNMRYSDGRQDKSTMAVSPCVALTTWTKLLNHSAVWTLKLSSRANPRPWCRYANHQLTRQQKAIGNPVFEPPKTPKMKQVFSRALTSHLTCSGAKQKGQTKQI
jgi:hypothetical protein